MKPALKVSKRGIPAPPPMSNMQGIPDAPKMNIPKAPSMKIPPAPPMNIPIAPKMEIKRSKIPPPPPGPPPIFN